MEAWRNELYHYAKGETAKNHKYIRKEGNRYIYTEPKSGSKNGSTVRNSGFGGSAFEDDQTYLNRGSFENGLNDKDKTRLENNAKYYFKAMSDRGITVTDDNIVQIVHDIMSGSGYRGELFEDWYKSAKEINSPRVGGFGQGNSIREAAWYVAKLADEYKAFSSKNASVSHSESCAQELYHTAGGGTLIITRR